jgi:hypothetical protein
LYFSALLLAPVTAAKENTLNQTEVVEPEKVKEQAPKDELKVEKVEEQVVTEAPKAKETSSNAFASSSSTNSFNVITDRPTSRVLAPPGGHTSIRLW